MLRVGLGNNYEEVDTILISFRYGLGLLNGLERSGCDVTVTVFVLTIPQSGYEYSNRKPLHCLN